MGPSTERSRASMSDMVTIAEDDLIESVADALQYISYYHPMDYIRALGEAYEVEQGPAAPRDPRRSGFPPPQHPRQHAVRAVGGDGAGTHGFDRRCGEGRGQREQVEVQDDEPQRQHRRLGARN